MQSLRQALSANLSLESTVPGQRGQGFWEVKERGWKQTQGDTLAEKGATEKPRELSRGVQYRFQALGCKSPSWEFVHRAVSWDPS